MGFVRVQSMKERATMVEETKQPDERMEELAALTFEEALTELELVVERLESEVLPLDEAVELYNKGQALAKLCRRRLDEVELKVERLSEAGPDSGS
jgi:exodeoxyribonuclease VII small subunit